MTAVPTTVLSAQGSPAAIGGKDLDTLVPLCKYMFLVLEVSLCRHAHRVEPGRSLVDCLHRTYTAYTEMFRGTVVATCHGGLAAPTSLYFEVESEVTYDEEGSVADIRIEDKKRGAPWLLVFLLLIVAAIIGWWLWSNRTSADTTTGTPGSAVADSSAAGTRTP